MTDTERIERLEKTVEKLVFIVTAQQEITARLGIAANSHAECIKAMAEAVGLTVGKLELPKGQVQ